MNITELKKIISISGNYVGKPDEFCDDVGVPVYEAIVSNNSEVIDYLLNSSLGERFWLSNMIESGAEQLNTPDGDRLLEMARTDIARYYTIVKKLCDMCEVISESMIDNKALVINESAVDGVILTPEEIVCYKLLIKYAYDNIEIV